MNSSLLALIGLSFLLGCGCWLFFLWGVHKGEFTDMERPKHRMLDDDDAPLPPRAQASPPPPRVSEAENLTPTGSPAEAGEPGERSRALPRR